MEDYIKHELIGKGSPRHQKELSNLFTVAGHYTHINTSNVWLLLLTIPMYTMLSHYKIIISCCCC